MIANATPTIRCHDGASWKNKMPANAMMAAASKNCRNGGKRTTFLEKKEKRDRAGADTDTGKQGIIKTSSAEFLIPSSRKPEDRQVDQDRQCRAGFDNETAETFTNAIGSEARKDLVRAIKYGSSDRVPKPGCHKTEV
jgi:hypothetical protein